MGVVDVGVCRGNSVRKRMDLKQAGLYSDVFRLSIGKFYCVLVITFGLFILLVRFIFLGPEDPLRAVLALLTSGKEPALFELGARGALHICV